MSRLSKDRKRVYQERFALGFDRCVRIGLAEAPYSVGSSGWSTVLQSFREGGQISACICTKAIEIFNSVGYRAGQLRKSLERTLRIRVAATVMG